MLAYWLVISDLTVRIVIVVNQVRIIVRVSVLAPSLFIVVISTRVGRRFGRLGGIVVAWSLI